MRHDPAPLFDDKTIVTLLAAGAALAVVAAAVPAAAALLYAGQLPDMSLAEAAAGTVKIAAQGRFADPAAAYPAAAQAQLPAAAGFYAAALWLAATVAAAAVGGWRQLDRLRARAWLGRRPYDPRGARPRGWARPRDLAELVVAGPERDRFTVGRLDRRRLATDDQAHVVVCAPPRTGKTTRCVIPWLLEHDGPAIVTSTRRDVLDASEGWRRRLGRVWIWDPFTAGSARWTPLERCQSWEHALQQAQWLADAAEDGDSDVARFWRGEAAKLLAPLLHAAALERGSMAPRLGC